MIKLIYYSGPNFGDRLSPYIIHKLSGEPVQRKDYYRGVWYNVKCIIKYCIQGDFSEIRTLTWTYERVLLGIGSIIYAHNKNSVVWGSGFLSAEQRLRKNCELKVLATRGTMTSEMVCQSGYSTTRIYGDPAMLLPLIYAPQKIMMAHEIGLIPHYSELELFKNTYSQKAKVIDVTNNNIEQIIDQICSCKVVLSSSLHGIIVAHSYGIPAIWIKGNSEEPGVFKFYDYFASVGIDYYTPFPLESFASLTQSEIRNHFQQNENIALPNNKRRKNIQTELLLCALFDVRDKYRGSLTNV